MKLHYHPVSPYARKALVAVTHRGDDCALHLLDLPGGELRSEAYLALSPYGKMPVLETDEGPIFESTSIVEWLEEQGPRVLVPDDRARIVRHWDRIADLYLIDAQSEIWFRPGTEAAERAASRVAVTFELMARQLEQGPFLAGEVFTLADLGAAIAVDYLGRLDVPLPEPIRAWCDRCFEVPAMAAGLEAALPIATAMLKARTGG